MVKVQSSGHVTMKNFSISVHQTKLEPQSYIEDRKKRMHTRSEKFSSINVVRSLLITGTGLVKNGR